MWCRFARYGVRAKRRGAETEQPRDGSTGREPAGSLPWSFGEGGLSGREGNRNPSLPDRLFRPFLSVQKGARRRHDKFINSRDLYGKRTSPAKGAVSCRPAKTCTAPASDKPENKPEKGQGQEGSAPEPFQKKRVAAVSGTLK